MTEQGKPSFSIPEETLRSVLQGSVPEKSEDAPPLNQVGREDQVRIIDQHIEDRIAERALRQRYAGLAFSFAVGGAVFWVAILLWHGLAGYFLAKPLFSDNVLIAVTTATSVNLFAAFLGVIRGLFPSSAGSSKKSE